MGFLRRLLRSHSAADSGTAELDDAVERIAQMHPSLRLARQYRARLSSSVGTSLGYLRELVDGLPAPRTASAESWASDPYIHAFFAAPDDVARAISRSETLREFFAQHVDVPMACAVLGMEMTERHGLGAALEGDTLRRDVPRTTINFSDHQVRLCGRSDADLRREIVARLVDQLALEGLTRIAGDKSRRLALTQERALLKTRLQLLERQGSGIRSVIGSDAASGPDELARLHLQIAQNAHSFDELGLTEDALAHELERISDVFAEPARHIYLHHERLRLDRMNVAVEKGSTRAFEYLDLHIAHIPGTPPRLRAFALVNFARADLLPAASIANEAGRLLS